ncbi:ABC transporter permease [Aquimarina muelleri]|uniref:ABC transporter permease n=1 Tax=Aquimarina muelleri TaxID=279356 RepID=UPI003F682E78
MKNTLIKELKELFRDGRIRLAGGIVILLLGMAVWISSSQYHKIKQQNKISEAHERENWEDQGEKNPHSAAHYGTYAFKPQYPLGFLDKGIEKYAGTSVFMEAHKRNEAQFSPVIDQTGLARFGELSPDFILLFIIPLLIILMGYNSFTKERELGTVSLLKSQGVKSNNILFGKWLSLFLPIIAITLLLFLIAGILLSGLEGFGWGSLFLLLLVYWIYYAVFINITLLTSRLSKSSSIALVVMLSVWIVSCLVVPKATGNIADSKYPYPTRQQFTTSVLVDKEKGLDGHNPWSKEAKKLEQQTLAKYKVDSLAQLPFNYDAFRMQKGEEHEAKVYQKHYQKLRDQFAGQASTYRSLSILSPFLPARFLSMGISRTDYHSHWDFEDATENYRIVTQKFLNDNFAKNSSYGDWGYKVDSSFWKDLPKFNYEHPSLNKVLEQQLFSLVILMGWLLISFLLLLTVKNKI